MDLAPDETGDFVWTYTAATPGTIIMVGAASGTGFDTGIDHASAPATSGALRIHTPVPERRAFCIFEFIYFARPDSTRITVTIQNHTMTRGSGQPLSSK